MEYYRVNQHSRECPACRSLLRALESAPSCPTLDTDLSDAILRRTSGNSCRKANELLCDFTDGNLDNVRHELVSAHLRHCSRCAKLARTLSELKEMLPTLAELRPTPPLVPEVLAATRAPSRTSLGFVQKASLFLSDLLRRPRFSWEAAYLGTLLIFALFGTPGSPIPDAGSRMLAALEQQDGLVPMTRENIARAYKAADLGWTGIQKATDRMTSLRVKYSESRDAWIKAGRVRVEDAGKRVTAIRDTGQQLLTDLSRKMKPANGQ
jgi:hypothetical protein